ncbi:hypothetical protein DRP77_13020 [Candidatus Poribacteria bacterium]|nr:MAG: hypothetical protein DRP77_13020 [Candidatus Poribacteria bacterium]
MSAWGIVKRAASEYASNPLRYILLCLPGRAVFSAALWVAILPSAQRGGAPFGVALTVSVLSALIAYPITSPPPIASVAYELIGERGGIGRPFRRTFKVFFPLLGTFIMWLIFMGIGLALFAFPALLLYVRHCLAPHAVIIEGEGGYGAMRRGKAILEGEFGRGMAVMLFALFAEVLAGQLIGTALLLLKGAEGFGAGWEYLILGFILPLLFDPFRALLSTELYLSLRREKEGLTDESFREEFLEWER